ncbi:asparagine synthase-related protein [Pengzhenrongella sicca]|uniref:Asparagine synthetase domain-containing protein n=1 Tax=Pengzhenrongella sicca TaxID=2819238 RepID=A0A8A4ZDC5_9MICO|nr:asparagine synthase-related protein [Pengzhenrongella sicca]QTE29421.1 hypothetical protein J4E96_19520 [Pengzhenrongella sicca]
MPDGLLEPQSPLAALELAVLPALRRAPCLVSFSGGLDSSFVLAVATRVARREGLELPVPCTWRFPDAPEAFESPSQETVVTALGLPDWVRLDATDELDLLGPVAQRVLRAHGVVYPANAHLHLPLLERATGGSLLTGAGGDQVLMGWPTRPGRSLRRVLTEDVVPVGVRSWVSVRRGSAPFPWLHPHAARRVLGAYLNERRVQPQRFDRRVAWHAARRAMVMTLSSLDAIAADVDVELRHPILDPGFVQSLAHAFGATGPRRPQLLEAIAASQIAPEVFAARPKARFNEVFFREPTRQFVQSGDFTGVDDRYVDVQALRRVWSSWPIPAVTALLAQQLWLTAQGRHAS